MPSASGFANTVHQARSTTVQLSALPAPYRRACELARVAEEVLDQDAVNELTFDLLSVHDQAELEEFVRKVAHRVRRTAKKTTSAARRSTPLGALSRSTYGALSAALRGQKIFIGALDGLVGTPMFAALIKVSHGVLRGDNLIKAAKLAAKAGVADAREALRLAAMVAPFVPGIGTGVGAALGAADALANGQPITQALIAGVRGAIPGGAIAQGAFEMGTQLAQGKRLDQALLTTARSRLPPGPAQAAFDAGLAIGQGKKLQDAAVQAAGGLLPPSPYAADLKSFAQRALAGDNLGQAALSTAGQAVLLRVQRQGGDLVATVQGRTVAAAAPAVAVAPPPPPVTLDQMITASNLAERRRAEQFMAALRAPQRS